MSKLVGASVWEESLYEHLVSHEASERKLLEEYHQAAAESPSLAFRYLAALIVEDERRHHRLFRELASALRSSAEMRPEQPAVPYVDLAGPDAAKVVELSERFLAHEHADAKDLRRLAGQMKDVRDTTLWGLLIRLMEMDTAKHIEILEFARRHARSAR